MANSQTSGAGLFGFALQGTGGATKGTPAATMHYIPALSVSLGADQRVSALPFEVGGPLWQRNAYKQSVVVGGDVSFNLRPRNVGWLLYALCGSYGTAASGDLLADAGLRAHRFAPNMTPGQDLPWLTLSRHLPSGPAEQYTDCLVRSFRLEVPANNVVNCSLGFQGITPKEITPLTTADSGVSSNMDGLHPLVTAVGSVDLNGYAASTVPATRISIDITNELSQDEFEIGSYYLNDITLLSRSMNISFDTVIRDATLYRAVMRNGASSLPGAWDGTLTSGHLTVLVKAGATAASGNCPAAPSNPEQLKLYIPSMDFLTLPIAVAGNNLVRATLAGQVTLISGVNDVAPTLTVSDITTMKAPFVMELCNAFTDDYTSGS